MKRINYPILIIDDDVEILEILKKILEQKNYINLSIAENGTDGLTLFKKINPSVIIVDIMLPDMSGLELVTEIKKLYPPCQIIVITGYYDIEYIKKALQVGSCDYIVKPVEAEIFLNSVDKCIEKFMLIEELEVHQKQLENLITMRTKELENSNRRNYKLLKETIAALSKTVEMKDPYTSGHQIRTSILAKKIASKMDKEFKDIEILELACLLHDIGKIAIPSELLVKPSKLSKIEFELIKCHSEIGYTILKDVEQLGIIPTIILQHHERIDGSGYPNKLKKEQIHHLTKILSVSDFIEATFSHRPYRGSLKYRDIIQLIDKEEGKKYCPEVCKIVKELLEQYKNKINKLFEKKNDFD